MRISSLLVSIALTSALVSAQQTAASGQPEDHRFQAAGLQLDGLQNLSELRGKPVLVEFWGVN